MADKPKLMISYCHANKAEAQKIRTLLDVSFQILMDQDYFELSKSTKPEMKRMVGDADVVLVLLSQASVVSKAVRYEVTCALARESTEQRKILFAGMIDPCTPMPEWDSTRLYANLCSNFDKEFSKLKRSLQVASAKALPKATAILDSRALGQLAKASVERTGFKVHGEVELIARNKELPDNPLSTRIPNIDGLRRFSVFIATLGTWTCFFYMPNQPMVGRLERTFAIERWTIRTLLAARLGGYLAHRKVPFCAERESY
ncbi:toll/interleukin-1 receptor domain-containing protein [Edaphobacter aggregans]|uniref:toll/interleukin-1 receptor domain-containing protein n=1 Tax=Edaphobacter aggregans TaxID=570835 RepID=UPI000550A0E1|nr:toll/interleukin-1 receptor domain-containing protein [Edaphobacter aggregans]